MQHIEQLGKLEINLSISKSNMNAITLITILI